MKKFGVVLMALMAAAIIGFAGCASGPRQPPGPAAEPFTIDFEGLGIQTRNEEAFTQRWDDFFIRFPEFPGVNFTAFSRVTIRVNYFDIDGNQIEHADDLAMVTLIYNPAGDWRGPEDGPGPNTPLKQFNIGGDWGSVHTYRGSIVRLTQAPGGVLFQNSQLRVRYIEVTEITFHNR
ncbi:MAG: hypothetical protein FWD88_03565 [Treponema sp.]|nr:hypothetical protein [Treponema sp.]